MCVIKQQINIVLNVKQYSIVKQIVKDKIGQYIKKLVKKLILKFKHNKIKYKKIHNFVINF